MNTTLSALILALGLMVGAWIIGQNINRTATINNGNQNTLSVTGDGKVYVKPDTFLVTILAEEKSQTTKEGFAKVSEKIGLVQKLLKENGVTEKDIQSVNINIHPNYIYNDGRSSIDGFVATHGLSIKVRNFESIDAILGGISKISAVQIQSVGYDIDDKTTYFREARNQAIAKARSKAEDMAKASGITLGKVMSINENQGYPQPVYANQYATFAKMGAESDQGGAGVSAGQLEITTSVSLSYEIR